MNKLSNVRMLSWRVYCSSLEKTSFGKRSSRGIDGNTKRRDIKGLHVVFAASFVVVGNNVLSDVVVYVSMTKLLVWSSVSRVGYDNQDEDCYKRNIMSLQLTCEEKMMKEGNERQGKGLTTQDKRKEETCVCHSCCCSFLCQKDMSVSLDYEDDIQEKKLFIEKKSMTCLHFLTTIGNYTEEDDSKGSVTQADFRLRVHSNVPNTTAVGTCLLRTLAVPSSSLLYVVTLESRTTRMVITLIQVFTSSEGFVHLESLVTADHHHHYDGKVNYVVHFAVQVILRLFCFAVVSFTRSLVNLTLRAVCF